MNNQYQIFKKKHKLTNREMQVAEKIAEGKTSKQIAEDMGLKNNTIRSYRKSLYLKTEVHSKLELYRKMLNL